MKRFKLSDLQANAILEMQLRRLAALERKKIETEYKETLAQIKELERLLKSAKKMRVVAADELLKVKAAFGDRRRTQIVSMKGRKAKKAPLTAAELVVEQVVWIGMTAEGRLPAPGMINRHAFPVLKPPACWSKPMPPIPFTWSASVGWPRLWQSIPCLKLKSWQKAIHSTSNLLSRRMKFRWQPSPCQPGNPNFPAETTLLTVTRGGMIKKSLVTDLPGPSAQTFRLVNVNEGDSLGWVALADGKKEILLVTAQGMAIRFKEEDVRPMGLAAAGVNGIKLGVGDVVVGMQILPGTGDLFLVASDGKGKRVEVKDFPAQGRYGKGVIAWELGRGITLAGMAMGKPNTIVTLHLLKAAPKMARLDDAPLRKRTALRGDSVVEVKPGDALLGITEGWAVERYVELVKKEEKKKTASKKK